jgi:hypothetical protein
MTMISSSSYRLGVIALGLVCLVPAVVTAASHQEKEKAPATASAAGKLVPASELDAAWLEKARKAYPLKHCLVSDEDLGSMGKSPEFAYRVAGQPDRLVIFCCEGCEEDFLKEPAKFLAKVKPGAAKPAEGKHEKAH